MYVADAVDQAFAVHCHHLLTPLGRHTLEQCLVGDRAYGFARHHHIAGDAHIVARASRDEQTAPFALSDFDGSGCAISACREVYHHIALYAGSLADGIGQSISPGFYIDNCWFAGSIHTTRKCEKSHRYGK